MDFFLVKFKMTECEALLNLLKANDRRVIGVLGSFCLTISFSVVQMHLSNSSPAAVQSPGELHLQKSWHKADKNNFHCAYNKRQ